MCFASNLIFQPEDYLLSKPLTKKEGESVSVYQYSTFSIAQYKYGYAEGLICGNETDGEKRSKCFEMYDSIENKKMGELVNKATSRYDYHFNYNLNFSTKTSISFIFKKGDLEKLEKKYTSKLTEGEKIQTRNLLKEKEDKLEKIHECFVDSYKTIDPYEASKEYNQRVFSMCLN